jgi:ferrous iron transport protein A
MHTHDRRRATWVNRFSAKPGLACIRIRKFKDMEKLDISRSTLDQAVIGEAMTVQRVDAPAQSPEWSHWLEEIGFVTGEEVRLMARAIPGGDPMVVRVGQSTFALRRAEAACISVAPVGVCAAVSLEDQAVAEGAGA